MKVWHRHVRSWSLLEIQAAVNDSEWQKFRLSLKGRSTEEKLDRLEDYMNKLCVIISERISVMPWEVSCRVDNYINALLRGGQLVHNRDSIQVQR